MFSKILIANRGEIALRIIRACRELDIRTVAVYSEADINSLHRELADEHICIGPPPSAKSYLTKERIIAGGQRNRGRRPSTPATATWRKTRPLPGCARRKVWSLSALPPRISGWPGRRSPAKRIMKEAGVPVIPGSDQGVATIEEALRIGEEIGYPIMVKASGGGGGRGIRICPDRQSPRGRIFPSPGSRPGSAFGNDEVYIEKYLERTEAYRIPDPGRRSGEGDSPG